MGLPEKVAEHIAARGLVKPRERFIVGVSGGLDSAALANIMSQIVKTGALSGPFAIAHLDHGLRLDSPEDFKFVRDLASSLGVKFIGKRVELAKMLGPDKARLEEEAREKRYRFFYEAACEFKATVVLTAHHADDQAETVLQRILRGTAMRGLAGIHETRILALDVRVVRPLLPFRRSEIEAYAAERSLKHREDSSNSDVRFTRNRIRHEILPMLEKVYPGCAENLAAVADAAQSALETLDDSAENFLKKVRKSKDIPKYRIADSEKYPEYLISAVLDDAYYILRVGRAGLDKSHYAGFIKIFRTATHGSALSLPGGVEARFDRGTLIFSIGGERVSEAEIKLAIPGKVVFGGWKIFSCVILDDKFDIDEFKKNKDEFTEIIDGRAAKGGLIIRVPREGDRFRPFGMKGAMRLGDFFTNLKVPLSERSFVPLVTAGDTILWVVGYRIGEQARVKSEKSLKILLSAKRI